MSPPEYFHRFTYLLPGVFFLLPGLTAESVNPPGNKPIVLASNSIIADIAKQLVDDQAQIISLVPLGMDPHSFEPTPGDIQLITLADLVLMNGMNLENWLTPIIKRSQTKAKVDTVTRGISSIHSGRFQSAVDPHAWLDPVYGKIYAENIAGALKLLVPDQKEIIDFNLAVLKDEMDGVDQYIQEKIAGIPENKRILITSHDAFRYFARRYNIRVESVFPTSPDAEVTIKDMIHLNKLIAESGAKAIFPESTINPRFIEQIASDNKLVIGKKLFTDSLSDEKGPASTYINLLYHNAKSIMSGIEAGLRQDPPIESVTAIGKTTSLLLNSAIILSLVGSFLFMWFKMDPVYGRKSN